MEIRVAVIGPEDLINQVFSLGKSYPEIVMIPVSYSHEQETLEVVQPILDAVDVLFFTGIIPYQITKTSLMTDKPMVFIPPTGTGLYRTLFKIITETTYNPLHAPLKMSVDTIDKAEVEECLEELEIIPEKVFLNVDQQADALVNFHLKMWEENSTHVAITCVKSVYERLKDLGILVYRVIPTKSAIRICLQNVLLEGKALLQRNTQIAIGILHFHNLFAAGQLSEYGIQRRKAALQNLLIDFSEEAQAIFDWSERDEVRFITTRGTMERMTQNYKKVPLINEITMKVEIETSLGIGFGQTANEAEHNAHTALIKAQSNKPSCFIVDLDGTVVGPVGQNQQLQYSLRSDDPIRMQLVKTSGLSVATINKLLSFCESFGTKSITALDLANGLGVTIRSARRILAILERSNLAVIVGEEQPIHRGRPRQLYEIQLA
ncbi:transcriptional regulator [Bacillus sp. M6-12]|uniref:transcriptional regulator n=1 Tax=Bacillus sp. M6-12 TaxID=2054166 RepID=UPI000C7855B2|nr:transcriptional regulator [Bacillus sp. M6-12]PLS17907.1 transcriptional regulator [Bacillus sp. M6-12]